MWGILSPIESLGWCVARFETEDKEWIPIVFFNGATGLENFCASEWLRLDAPTEFLVCYWKESPTPWDDEYLQEHKASYRLRDLPPELADDVLFLGQVRENRALQLGKISLEQIAGLLRRDMPKVRVRSATELRRLKLWEFGDQEFRREYFDYLVSAALSAWTGIIWDWCVEDCCGAARGWFLEGVCVLTITHRDYYPTIKSIMPFRFDVSDR